MLIAYVTKIASDSSWQRSPWLSIAGKLANNLYRINTFNGCCNNRACRNIINHYVAYVRAPPPRQVFRIMAHSRLFVDFKHLQTDNFKPCILKSGKNLPRQSPFNTIRLYYDNSFFHHFLDPLFSFQVLAATVHFALRGSLLSFNMFFSHLLVQKLTVFPVFLTKIFPVPGGIS